MENKESYIYSEKYDIHATVVERFGYYRAMTFEHNGKPVEIDIPHSIHEKTDEELVLLLESVAEKFKKHAGEKTMMYNWYIAVYEKSEGKPLGLHGIVTGHPKICDTSFTDTTSVKSITINREAQEVLVQTKNTLYHCPMDSCDISIQDHMPHLIDGYDEIRAATLAHKDPEIEPGNVLLVISDHDEYYYHSTFCIREEGKEPLTFKHYAHIGTFQDSFLIEDKEHTIDLRYFPHYGNIEFYSQATDGMPLYVENIGKSDIYCRTKCGTIKLSPGDRKMVDKSNTEKDTPLLPDGDLYPASVMSWEGILTGYDD